ncbi:MAG: acylneuraminate cytidylyltransferase family protein [Leptospira sp.]|nr:acylneuraminate cytidylyltransferase family protein [Leptospira sp.]
MKILALILARGGSKRLPGKNIRLLGEKPLIVWSIEIVKDIPEISDVLVSTDDEQIADISRINGGFVPWLRPQDLAKDDSTSVDAAIHAMDWYEKHVSKIDGLLLLQPTSPFRNKTTIMNIIKLFNSNQKTIVSVSTTHFHPAWSFKIVDSHLVPFLQNEGFNKRSQDLDPAYNLNGSFYLISPAKLRENKSFIDSETIPVVLNTQKESLDIDTELDFKMAEFLLNS